MSLTEREAYRKGWNAYERGTLLEKAEDNFVRRYGDELIDTFIGGFLDRNSDRPRYHDFECPLYNGGGDCPENH